MRRMHLHVEFSVKVPAHSNRMSLAGEELQAN